MVRFEDLRIFVSAADHGSFGRRARAGPDAGGRQRRPETAGADAGDAAVRPLHAQPAADGGRRALPGVRPLGHRHAGRRPQRAGARQDRHQRHAVDLGALGPGAQRAVALAGRIPAPPSPRRLPGAHQRPAGRPVPPAGGPRGALRHARRLQPGGAALVESNRRVVCASPAYLARHGTPQAPADLRRHNCLSFVLGSRCTTAGPSSATACPRPCRSGRPRQRRRRTGAPLGAGRLRRGL